MRLLDNLRSAEQKGVKAVRRSMARAREEWVDVERRIRQRMRIYPQKVRKNVLVSVRSDVEPRPDIPAQEPLANTEVRKPIISIHGRDIKDEGTDRPAA